MGVPAFYRWLAEKYPLTIVDVIEEEEAIIDGVKTPIDTSKPNPNNIEYDNLYLDMNGIIHPCFHPEDRPAPTTFDEVFQNVFHYIDRLFNIVRPRKLLYMAIDGVAPRAKMNQQRARRFRAAKEAADAAAEEKRLREEFEQQGRKLLPKQSYQIFDSNVITPGTEFMAVLSAALQYYIHLRLNTDPGWKSIKVILSDANVPGEGEHKIMSFIRLQRNRSGYNPNTRHCLYGLDADLIMLALATHEVHFSILREVVFISGQKDKCFICGQVGHFASECEGKIKRKFGEFDEKSDNTLSKQPFQFLNIWTLRQYLEQDLRIVNPPFEIDVERIVDDFVFMCFFVGNDFLPDMPTLDIREGAIDLLMMVYKTEFSSIGSYLTDGCKPNLEQVERFITAVGSYEDEIFQRRARLQQRKGKKTKYVKRSGKKKDDDNAEDSNSLAIDAIGNQEELKLMLRISLRDRSDLSNSKDREEDMIKLGQHGWRKRYYEEKFSAKSLEDMEKIRKDVVLKYIEGLCWVMHYYYDGVCSWQWFYPYHYAPFASDMKGIAELDIKFELGLPFKPFDQLLGVLPAASSHAVPEHYRKLMTDHDSPIIDFYPQDFEVDMNGKRFSWQGIAKLPFVDETRLLAEIAKVEDTLTAEEKKRNSVSSDMLFVSSSHALFAYISSSCKDLIEKKKAKVKKVLNPKTSGGMNGLIRLCAGEPCPPIFRSPITGMEDILDNKVICVIYSLPMYQKHEPRLLSGVKLPKQLVTMRDLRKSSLWHEGKKQTTTKTVTQVTSEERPTITLPVNPFGDAARRLVIEDVAHRLVTDSLKVKTIDNEDDMSIDENAMSISFTYAVVRTLLGKAPHPIDYSKMLPPPIIGQRNVKIAQIEQVKEPPTIVAHQQHQGPKQERGFWKDCWRHYRLSEVNVDAFFPLTENGDAYERETSLSTHGLGEGAECMPRDAFNGGEYGGGYGGRDGFGGRQGYHDGSCGGGGGGGRVEKRKYEMFERAEYVSRGGFSGGQYGGRYGFGGRRGYRGGGGGRGGGR